MALFRVDFSGRGELADRQQKLAQMLSRLQKISEGLVLFVSYVCQRLKEKIHLESAYLRQGPTYTLLLLNAMINQLSKCLISVSVDSKAHHPVH